jgi:hypothetical protein
MSLLNRPATGTRGYTVLEVTVVLGIVMTMIIMLAAVQKDVISLDSVVHGAFTAQGDARRAFRMMTKETRTLSLSENGSYPIVSAEETSFTFYSDVDSDGQTEHIRYFISADGLSRGIIEPSGSPATYDGTESTSVLVTDMANDSIPVFEYFDESYAGDGSPLASPFDTSDVRLVRITIIIDKNGDRTPEPQTYSTQVTLRNLKDNL